MSGFQAVSGADRTSPGSAGVSPARVRSARRRRCPRGALRVREGKLAPGNDRWRSAAAARPSPDFRGHSRARPRTALAGQNENRCAGDSPFDSPYRVLYIPHPGRNRGARPRFLALPRGTGQRCSTGVPDRGYRVQAGRPGDRGAGFRPDRRGSCHPKAVDRIYRSEQYGEVLSGDPDIRFAPLLPRRCGSASLARLSAISDATAANGCEPVARGCRRCQRTEADACKQDPVSGR